MAATYAFFVVCLRLSHEWAHRHTILYIGCNISNSCVSLFTSKASFAPIM